MQVVAPGGAEYTFLMTLWIVLALMTGAAVLAVLLPLSRSRGDAAVADPDAQFYREQIAEIDVDEGRRLISAQEAEAARAEAARRLLRSAADGRPAGDAFGEPALRRRRAASALALSTVPLVALTLYGALGSPQLPAQPLAARVHANPDPPDLAAAVAKVEAHLATHPGDGRGWEVIAPVYLRLGRSDDAVKAYATALRLLGESAPRLAAYGEALVATSGGIVSADARVAFERAAALDQKAVRARFYLAQAAEQDGDPATARARYEEVLAAGPNDAPWLPIVRERMARLQQNGGAAMPSVADRESSIRGMVEGLAARLDSRGGTPEEWRRLVQAYSVLGERTKAAAAVTKARAALAPDQTALAQIDAIARDLGLSSNERTR